MAIATSTALVLGGIAVVGAGTAIYQSKVSSDAAKSAAKSQRKSLKEAAAAQEVGFQRALGFQQPFLERGSQAFTQLADIVQAQAAQGVSEMPQFEFDLSNLQDDPGIQFAQEQSRKSLEASAAAGGSVLSGGTLQELQSRAIGLGGLQADQAFNRQLGGFQQNLAVRQQGETEDQRRIANLSQIAQVGPQSASNLSNIAVGHAGRAGDLAIQGGNVNAAETIARAQAVNQGVGGVSSSLQELLLLQTVLGSKSSGGGASGAQFPRGTGAGDLQGLNEGIA